MKMNLRAIGIGLLFIGASIFTACEGPEGAMGPAGPNGKDGTNGSNGVNGINGVNGVNGLNGKDGKDANASCLVCHTVKNFDAKIAEYQLSKHYMGSTSSRFTKYCARCHTHEGFSEIQGNGKFFVTNDMPNATRINCKTCHSHSGFNFSDTLAEILTTISPVFLNYNNNLTATDFGKTNNLCTQCHQIRGVTSTVFSDTVVRPVITNKAFNQLPFFPFLATKDDNASVKYQVGQSFSVHDGNQSNLFSGVNGYEYTGKNYDRKWKHSAFTCTDCHMNTFDAVTKTGGHTLIPNKAACTKCHGGVDKITPIQTQVDAKRVELAELLVTRKVFKKTGTAPNISYSAVQTHDFNGKLYPITQTAGDLFATTSSNNTVSPTTGLVIYGNIVKYAADADYKLRIGREWKYGELGAAYNYGYINSELSKGVHNPIYAMELLQESINWLKANPAK